MPKRSGSAADVSNVVPSTLAGHFDVTAPGDQARRSPSTGEEAGVQRLASFIFTYLSHNWRMSCR
ncbi:MAG: hypothetical protein R2849_19065, partial [Thermomicrobiales bacterium]